MAPRMATHPVGESKYPSICLGSVFVPLTDMSAIAASREVEPRSVGSSWIIVALPSLRSQRGASKARTNDAGRHPKSSKS